MISRFRCNGQENPVGVDRTVILTWETDFPVERFSVRVEKDGALQGGEEISSPVCRYDYRGKLDPLSDYSVRLICFGGGKEETAFLSFRTALTDGFPEDCKWISFGLPAEERAEGDPATVLRKTFDAAGTERTYLHVAGLGLFIAEINGKRVGRDVLNCPFTDYSESVLYATYDVTDLLRPKDNEIRVELGDGWYRQTARDEWGFSRAPWKDACKAIVLIEGGASVCSDESWTAAESGVTTASSLRLGERTDYGGKELVGEKNAVVLPPPKGKLKSMEEFPVRETEWIDFTGAKNYGGGVLYDFGTSVTGYVRIGKGFSGRILVRYGDRLDGRGRIDNASNAQYVYEGEYQTDFVAGDGRREYSPKFTYHAFRWVEIEGLGEPLRKGELQAVFIRSSFERIGDFSCDSERLNRLYTLAVRSLECNFTGIPTDCPHREKNGWTGDMQLSAAAYLLNFDCAPNLYKWLEDVVEAQAEAGAIPCIVPTAGWGYDWGNGPAWDFALFEVPYRLWKIRGDGHAVGIVYDACEKYLGFLRKKEEDGLIDWGLGDWNCPGDVGISACPVKLTSSCYYYESCRIFSEFSDYLGERGKAETYRNKAGDILSAIRREFLPGKEYGESVTFLAALLYFGVTTDEEKTLAELVALLEKLGYAACFGILGAKFTHNVLCRYGRQDVFLKMLGRSEYPSFGAWIEEGATSLWEDFEGKNSRNHHMFADVAAVMQTYLAGVGMREGKEGREITVSPARTAFSFLSARVPTVNGVLSLRVARTKGGREIDVEIPCGVPAVLVTEEGEKSLPFGRSAIFLPD